MGNLITPIFVRDGSDFGYHPIFSEPELVGPIDEIPATMIEHKVCSMPIYWKTGKSEVCEHKKYFRWQHLPKNG